MTVASLPIAVALALLLGACSSETPGSDPPDAGGGSEDWCVDEDGDRHGEGPGCLGTDCDDNAPYRYEGAPERCDSVDDDCDGQPDPCACRPWAGEEDCPDGEHCKPQGEDLIAACVALPAVGTAGDGEDCTAAPCAPALHCVRRGNDTLCTHTCDPYTNTGCPGPQECLTFLARNQDIGLCREPPPTCDIYDPFACLTGQACRPLFRRSGQVDNRCQDAGDQGSGQPCGAEAGLCAPGLLCVRASSGEERCQRVCRQDDDCREGEGRCQGETGALSITYCR